MSSFGILREYSTRLKVTSSPSLQFFGLGKNGSCVQGTIVPHGDETLLSIDRDLDGILGDERSPQASL